MVVSAGSRDTDRNLILVMLIILLFFKSDRPDVDAGGLVFPNLGIAVEPTDHKYEHTYRQIC